MYKFGKLSLIVCEKGGGGGGSGQVSYPEYMETMHSAWLTDLDTLIESIVTNSPYEEALAYDPDTDLENTANTLTGFNTLVTGISELANWANYYNQAANLIGDFNTEIAAKVDSYKTYIDNDLDTNILPKFKRSMQNVNASMSSAFIIGESIILEGRDRDIAKYDADLNLEYASKRTQLLLQASEQILKLAGLKYEFYKALVHYTVESNRIKIVAKAEETVNNLEYTVKDALWGLTSYREGGNMLAAIGGGTVQTDSTGPSKAQSAIGGALSGAAAGAMITGGNPMGAVAGGVLGLVGGLLS